MHTDRPYKPRIAVVGSGAVGCYYGGKLAAVGHDVHFLMRADLEAVRARGLTLRSTETPELHLPKPQVYATPEEIGPVDIVLIALKTTANGALETLIPPLLKPDGATTLVTLQNGLGNEEFLANRFGRERVMGALCFVCLNRVDSGVIEHYGHGTISIGEFIGAPQARTHALAGALRDAGIQADVVENLVTERWRKLVWNIPFNGLSVVAGGIPTDEILATPALEALVRGLMRETLSIAAAKGHPIPESYLEFQIERTRPMGAYKPSSLLDFWAGRPVEVESIWGEPLRQARSVGIEAARLETLYALIQKVSQARGFDPKQCYR
ncbi:MAG: 2-dehydropantoate 2-reductase [Verrucomicrobiota bacterium]